MAKRDKKALEDVELSHASFVILASLLWFEEQNKETTQTTIINHTKLDKMTVSSSILLAKKVASKIEDDLNSLIKLVKDGKQE